MCVLDVVGHAVAVVIRTRRCGHLDAAWLDPEKLRDQPLSDLQKTYLTASGFQFRALIYFAIWLALMFVFDRLSKQQDVNQSDRALRRRLKMLAGPGIILYAFAMTFAATRLIASQLYGVNPADPQNATAAASILIACLAVAGYLPARRASRIDPIRAQRQE